VSFDKVIGMIDEMVALLKKEQIDDDDKKQYCEQTIDETEDKIKTLERAISDLDKAIEDEKEGIASLKEEIESLEDGIKALDKAVAEATEQRKEEHAENAETVASDTAAKELIGFAKNRLNKFYNPKLYKPAPKRVLTEEERISTNFGGTMAPTAAPGGIAGTGITALSQVAPPPPPETAGPYKKMAQESNGVIAMMDMLAADLDKEIQETEVEEKNAQEEYEQFMKDSAAKRAADAKSIADKEQAKADLEARLLKDEDEHKATTKEAMATHEYLAEVHADCDWLLTNFEARKEARAGEVDSLTKAKAVLSGADYSLLQKAEIRRRI
jgi:chromosome segregation ATPase